MHMRGCRGAWEELKGRGREEKDVLTHTCMRLSKYKFKLKNNVSGRCHKSS